MKPFYWIIALLLGTTSCTDDFTYNPTGNREVLDALWRHVDENYAFFGIKNVDWDAVRLQYEAQLSNRTSRSELFERCADMLRELRDGHVNLRDGDQRRSYDYLAGFPVFFDFDLVRRDYLNGSIRREDRITYSTIGDSIGYLRIPGFTEGTNFNPIVDFFRAQNVDKVIVDLRNNGGGDIATTIQLIEHFIDAEAAIGFQLEKTGPARDAFTEPLPLTAFPRANRYPTRVHVLINRGSYSAASMFSGMVNHLDNFRLIGQITGGGGGGAQSFELPNGWVVNLPQGFYLDAEMNHVEEGVEPDVEVVNTEADLMEERDMMLEAAMAL